MILAFNYHSTSLMALFEQEAFCRPKRSYILHVQGYQVHTKVFLDTSVCPGLPQNSLWKGDVDQIRLEISQHSHMMYNS